MARRWPAAQIESYLRLIDDPLSRMTDDGAFALTEVQARAILDLRLQRLTQLGVKEVTDGLEELAAAIKEYLAILGSRERVMGIVAEEMRGGTGHLLASWIEQAARDLGALTITLKCETDNAPAMRIYEAAGYEVLSEKNGMATMRRDLD